MYEKGEFIFCFRYICLATDTIYFRGYQVSTPTKSEKMNTKGQWLVSKYFSNTKSQFVYEAVLYSFASNIRRNGKLLLQKTDNTKIIILVGQRGDVFSFQIHLLDPTKDYFPLSLYAGLLPYKQEKWEPVRAIDIRFKEKNDSNLGNKEQMRLRITNFEKKFYTKPKHKESSPKPRVPILRPPTMPAYRQEFQARA